MKFLHPLTLAVGAVVLLGLALPARAADEPDRAARENTVHVRGRITDVRPAEHLVTIQIRKGEEIKLTVDQHSRLQLNGQDVRLDQFSKGMPVRVAYRSEGGKHEVVSMSDPLLTADRLQKEINDVLASVKSYSFEMKDEYQKKLEGVLENLDERIGDLQERATQYSGEARRQAGRQIEDLLRKREVVRKQLARVREASPGAWNEIKQGLGAAVSDIQKAIERARARFEQTPPPPDR